MDHHVAFDPALGVDAQAFVAAWNEAPPTRALAEARPAALPPRGFALDPGMVQQGLVLLATAAGTLALDALKDAVKDKLAELFKEGLEGALSAEPEVEVQAIRQPGGAYLLVVTGREP